MYEFCFTFPSLTRAQRASSSLNRYGIQHALQKTPAYISKHGCSYCIRIAKNNYVRVLQIFSKTTPGFDHVFQLSPGGQSEEVSF